MRFTDLVLTIPLLVVVAVVSVGYPSAPWYIIPVILGLFGWTGLARIVRAEFLSLREKEFVEAARAVGATDRRIIFQHILPNLAGPIIVAATLAIAGAILIETALSFLGLGVRPPDVSLGFLIQDGLSAFKTRPWLFWFPSAAIVIICLCVNFIGDGSARRVRPQAEPDQGVAMALLEVKNLNVRFPTEDGVGARGSRRLVHRRSWRGARHRRRIGIGQVGHQRWR